MRTLGTERYRMSLREGEDWDELYDLVADPHELDNLYDDSGLAETRCALTDLMLRRTIEMQDRVPLPAYQA